MADSESHVVLITGGGGGLGSTMARGLLDAGRRVVALDLPRAEPGLAALRDAAAAAGAGERLFTTTVDVRSPDECEAAVARAVGRFGAVHALVNNAGLGPPRDGNGPIPFLDVPVDYWRVLFETNVNGPFFMTRAVAPRLIAGGWGRIVNVTTSLTTMVAAGMTPYGPAKAALEASAAIWAKELAGTGVTANVLVPGGAADTPMVPRDRQPDRSKLVPPSVMVAPIVWLCSRASDGTTGRRFIGKDWDPGAPLERNLQAAMSPVAW